jgi:hypothetical protein
MSSNNQTPRNQVSVWRARWPWAPAGLEAPATFAGLYRAAASLIVYWGYDPYCTYHGAPGRGIAVGGTDGALYRAAQTHLLATTAADTLGRSVMHGIVMEWVDALEKRLAAVLFLTGQVSTLYGRGDLADAIGGWELHQGSDDAADERDVTAALELAASLILTIPADAPDA